MTLFGKLLVFLNLGLSVMLAALGLGFYTNRLDWTMSPAKDGMPPGELKQRQDALRVQWAKVPPAANIWRMNLASLQIAERGVSPDGSGSRSKQREWYAAELEALRTGDAPLQAVVVNQGTVAMDPNSPGRPQLAPARDKFGNPLRSMKYYLEEEKKQLESLTALDAALQKAVQEDILLTEVQTGPADVDFLERLLAIADPDNPPDAAQKMALEQQRERILRAITAVKQEPADPTAFEQLGAEEILEKLQEMVREMAPPRRKPMPGEPAQRRLMAKGLRQRGQEEAAKRDQVLEEVAIIEPQLVNARVESELIIKRRDSLGGRLKELRQRLGLGEGAAAED